jgi:hypothetical protein
MQQLTTAVFVLGTAFGAFFSGCRSLQSEKSLLLSAETNVRLVDLTQGERLTFFGYELKSVRKLKYDGARDAMLLSLAYLDDRIYSFSNGEVTYDGNHGGQQASALCDKNEPIDLGSGRVLCKNFWPSGAGGASDLFDLVVKSPDGHGGYESFTLGQALSDKHVRFIYNIHGDVAVESETSGSIDLFFARNSYKDKWRLKSPVGRELSDPMFFANSKFYAASKPNGSASQNIYHYTIDDLAPANGVEPQSSGLTLCAGCKLGQVSVLNGGVTVGVIKDQGKYLFQKIDFENKDFVDISMFDRFVFISQLSDDLLFLRINTAVEKVNEYYLFKSSNQTNLFKLDQSQMPYNLDHGFLCDLRNSQTLLYTADPLGRGNDVYKLDLSRVFTN